MGGAAVVASAMAARNTDAVSAQSTSEVCWRRRPSRWSADPVGMARAGHAGGDEERQARRDRSARRDDARRLLGDGRGRREARSTA